MSVSVYAEGHPLAEVPASQASNSSWAIIGALGTVSVMAGLILSQSSAPAAALYSTTGALATSRVNTASMVAPRVANTAQWAAQGATVQGASSEVLQIPRSSQDLAQSTQLPQGSSPVAVAGVAVLGTLMALVGYVLHRLVALNNRVAMAATTGTASSEDAEAPSQPERVPCPNCNKCDGSGRIMGGLAALPWPFSLWPIKVYRPCPNFKGEYQRMGQTLNDLAGGNRAPQQTASPNAGKVVKMAKKSSAMGTTQGFGKEDK